ncbi:stress response translation initiation inhibitor YciH [Salinimonas chungwhensis]|jgi:translation initiation factor 1|uniref:stress response translation initiation inhibitor YciH n=1 Tax=Salinimonas chungwhensis TaxID=265425 RepID=UPI00036A908A|nr:stress response translation initiation inhibitor YciH [Salinimonas chungwhensis]
MNDSKLVYSTDTGRIKHDDTRPSPRSLSSDGVVRISRETKGRKGKGVSIVTGLDMDAKALKSLCSELKKKCGCGGAVKDGAIEVQTDDREKLKSLLQAKHFTVKLAGG